MTITFKCDKCEAVVNAKDELAGKRAKCPKCGCILQIPADQPVVRPPSQPTEERGAPARRATERQKEYARSLGIEFDPDIDRGRISRLIDDALERKDEQRWERLNDLERKEEDAKQEILSELQIPDMLDELHRRGLGAVLITLDLDAVREFTREGLNAIELHIQASDSMTTEAEMVAVLEVVALQTPYVRNMLEQIVRQGNLLSEQHNLLRRHYPELGELDDDDDDGGGGEDG